MMAKIITAWHRLSQRERILLSSGAVLLAFILFYSLIWSPLSTAVNTLKTNIQTQQHLLLLMEQTNQKVQRIKRMGLNISLSTQQPTLSLVESTLAQHQLSQYVSSVEQPDATTVALTLKAVPFDDMMDCIESLWYHYTIEVTAMNVKKTEVKGEVDVTVVLKRKG